MKNVGYIIRLQKASKNHWSWHFFQFNGRNTKLHSCKDSRFN